MGAWKQPGIAKRLWLGALGRARSRQTLILSGDRTTTGTAQEPAALFRISFFFFAVNERLELVLIPSIEEL